MKIPSMRPEAPRDGFGRYRLPDPTTGRVRAWSRTTTVVGSIKDLNGLIGWKRRKVAEGFAHEPHLLASVPRLAAAIETAAGWQEARDAKAAFDELCDRAARAGGAEQGSDAGTQLHTLTEYADAGRIAEVIGLATETELTDLGAYTMRMDTAGIARPVEWIERVVINPVVDAAGTLDRIVILPDGRRVIADLKTQQSVDFGWLEIAAQLAVYAHASHMIGETVGDLELMPDVDQQVGLVMHLPAGSGRCDLYIVDLVAGWEAAQTAARVRELRRASKAMGKPYVADPAPGSISLGMSVDVERDPSFYLIEQAQHPEALRGLWADLDARGEWTPAHTEAARRRKAELAAQGVAA